MFDLLEQRIQKLEENSIFQDETIDDLSQVIIDQQKQIDALVTDIARLQAALSSVADPGEKTPDPPPPHY